MFPIAHLLSCLVEASFVLWYALLVSPPPLTECSPTVRDPAMRGLDLDPRDLDHEVRDLHPQPRVLGPRAFGRIWCEVGRT